jgi:putative ABC transport system permease protein
VLDQIREITLMNLLNLPSRLGSSSVIVVGIAGVVAVLVGLLAMAAGFSQALESTSKADRAIVMQSGTTSELNGAMSASDRATVSAMEGINLASGELFVVAAIDKKGTDITANVVVRGVEPQSFEIRPELQITSGRNFVPGRAEIIVGVRAASQYVDLDVGRELAVRDQVWTIVGHFTANGTSIESEIWANLANVQSAYRRGGTANSLRIRVDSPEDIALLNARLESDPRFDLMVRSETEHYAGQSESRTALIEGFGFAVGVIMAVGAVFAALNTMYSAVSSRTVEIATLRALGFGNAPVVVSVLIEALTLALLGGLLGSALVWLAFDGYTASTLNGFAQVGFDFAVTGELLQLGLTWALLLGFVGGLFPALRAARLPISSALRGE